MPPSPPHTLGLHVLLLVVRAALFALVEGVLYPDVRGDFPLRSLETQQTRNLERVSDLDLQSKASYGRRGIWSVEQGGSGRNRR